MDTTDYKKSSTVVEDYVKSWDQFRLYYEKFAGSVAKKCQDTLKSRNILCNVTWRAKESKSLDRKLKQRLSTKTWLYKNEEDIRNDIQDLAGVRIALYLPSDKDEVNRVLREELIIEKDSEKTDMPTTGPLRNFPWYSATHYVVRLKQEDLDILKRLGRDFGKKTRAEIQLTSVFRHALAEVEHNAGYKQLRGSLTREEHNAFDCLGGLVHMGETLLNQLKDCFDRKKASDDMAFEDVYQLGSFLSKLAVDFPDDNERDRHPLEGLIRLLRFRGLNSPNELRKIHDQLISIPLDQMKDITKAYENLRMPVSVRIMDYIESASPQNNIEQFTAKETLAVIISTFIWLDEFFGSDFAWQQKLLSPNYTQGHEVRHNDLSWLGTIELKHLLDSETIATEDEERLRGIARWFHDHIERPIKLAFNISAMDRSFLRDLDREWHLFERAFYTIREILHRERVAHRVK